MDYKGIRCPVCAKPFTENDDIVVCPTCGAPYHRECYNEKGECIFSDLHETGSAWAPPDPPKTPDISSEIKDKECPRCGVLNAHSAMFCNVCGASLTGAPDQHRNDAHPADPSVPEHRDHTENSYYSGNYPPPQTGGAFRGFGGVPFQVDPMGGVNPMDTADDGVTYGEVSKLVQQNTGYYMSVFKSIRSYNRSKFNFSAFLFSGGWLLYRKQYKTGLLFTVLMFLLYIGQLLLSNFVTMPIMLTALDQAGVVNDAELTYVQAANITSEYLLDKPGEAFLFFSPIICMALMFVIMLVVGFMGNRLYMRHCVRTVRKIKSTSQSADDTAMAYNSHGGVNVAVLFCLFACYMVLQWIPMLFG